MIKLVVFIQRILGNGRQTFDHEVPIRRIQFQTPLDHLFLGYPVKSKPFQKNMLTETRLVGLI